MELQELGIKVLSRTFTVEEIAAGLDAGDDRVKQEALQIAALAAILERRMEWLEHEQDRLRWERDMEAVQARASRLLQQLDG